MKWPTIRLGDVCRVVPGFAFKSQDWTTAGIPVVKIKNIREDNTVDLSATDHVPADILTPRLSKFVLKNNDILLAMTGATAGKVGRVRTNRPVLLNQRVAKIAPEKADPRFIWSIVSSQRYQELFFRLADGAAQPNMSGGQIEGLEIPNPPIEVQRRVGAILSAYDDLIENNTRRIAILEEMARRLYEEWFVRFRFPGHQGVRMVESELGLVPEGWAITELGALLSVEKGLSYKGSGLTGNGVPMVNLKNILPGGGFRRDGTKPYSGEYKPRHVVRAGDIVLANTDLTQAGTVVGSPAIVPNMGVSECIFSHHIYAVRLHAALAPSRPYVYWMLAHDSFKSFAKGHAVGTTVLGMPKEGVTNFRFARPHEDLIRRFSNLAAPVHDLAEKLHAKTANLRATRDLLLPKLISGELDVSAMPEPQALAA